MSTGDMKNNINKLLVGLKKVRIPEGIVVNSKGLESGNMAAYLPIYDYLFQWYSPAVADAINEKGLKLSSYKQDCSRFIEGVYLILREVFNFKPPVSILQFKTIGFIERKVLMCIDVVDLVRQMHNSLSYKLQLASTCAGLNIHRKGTLSDLISQSPNQSPNKATKAQNNERPKSANVIYNNYQPRQASQKSEFELVSLLVKELENKFSSEMSSIFESIEKLETRISLLESHQLAEVQGHNSDFLLTESASNSALTLSSEDLREN